MIDVSTETLVTMPDAAAVFPRRPNVATLWRWRTKGVNGRKLESIVVGGRIYTSIEAIQRFVMQQGGQDAPALRSPTRRERDITRAEQELRAAGV